MLNGKQLEYLTGNQVLVREFNGADITGVYVSWLNDPEVTKFSNQKFIHHTSQSCKTYFESFGNSANMFLCICDVSSLIPIGTMTVYFNQAHETADVGIMIGNKGYWGNGCGVEAWQLLMDWLFKNTNIKKITGGAMSVNHGMLKIMRRTGMVLEAVKPYHEAMVGRRVHMYYYSKLNHVQYE